MDPILNAAARALAAGDVFGALNRVALRDDAPALALRGISLARMGDLGLAKRLLRRAASSFGPGDAVSRARCVVAEAEIALASRELAWNSRGLESAWAVLERGGDRVNASHARMLDVRRWLLLGRLTEAEQGLGVLDARALSPPLKALRELVLAGIAMRRLQGKVAAAALARAAAAARYSGIAALMAEVDAAAAILDRPMARLISRGKECPLNLGGVDKILDSGLLLVDACRFALRGR
ncbi:MAG: helix-turn-helix domain-containing protein, partial [bacterium]